MDNLSRNLIAIVLISVFLLVGCELANLPETTPIPTEVPTSDPTKAPTESPKTPAPTRTPQSTDQPVDLSNLIDYPLLEPGNLPDMVNLGVHYLDPGQAKLKFRVYDWSNDGSRIAICTFSNADNENSYQVFDLKENTKLADIQISGRICQSYTSENHWLQFSRDSSLFLGLIVLDHSDGYTYYAPAVFNSLDGEMLSVLIEQPVGVKFPPEVAFSSQGTRLALSDNIASSPVEDPNAEAQAGFYMIRSVEIKLFDVQTGGQWGTFLRYSEKYVRTLAYSTSGQYLVVGTDQAAEAWHVKGDLSYTVDCPVAGISFSPVAETAALTCVPWEGEPNQLLWDLESGKVYPIADAPGSYTQELRFSTDGHLLIGLSDAGEVSIWNGESGEHLITLPDTYPTSLDANFIGDGRLVAVLLEDGRLQLYGVK